MTKEQYKLKYGVEPTSSFVGDSTVDNTPTPIQMTQEEYNFKYRPELMKKSGYFSQMKEDLRETGEAQQAAVERGIDRSQEIEQLVESGENTPFVGQLKKFGSGLGAAADVLFQTGFGAVKSVLPESTEKRLGETIGKDLGELFSKETYDRFIENLRSEEGGLLTGDALDKKAADFLEESVQAYKTDQDFRTTVQSVGGFSEWIMLPNTARTFLVRSADEIAGMADEAITVARKTVDDIKSVSDEKIVTKRANDILDIETSYSKTRKALDKEGIAGVESRKRIASTDVLTDAVDDNGVIRTTDKGGAVDQYKALTVDGVEDVVSRLLEKEAKQVNVNEVFDYMKVAIFDAGLEGNDLVKAINGLGREIEGLSIRADEFGNVPLSQIHKNKISATQNINYLRDSNPSINTRKAKASAYRQIIEDKSGANIKEINKELSKYYMDIERLKRLDGRRVKGGRLGKHFSQLGGQVVGGAFGSTGGALGAGVGAIAGGEFAEFIQGRAMKKAFGRQTGNVPEKNPILERARREADVGNIDLRTPDPVVGVPSNIKKTPEIIGVEKQIKRNVNAQKVAIKAGDFTLVATLKDVYRALVQKLKNFIENQKSPRRNLNQSDAPITPTTVQNIELKGNTPKTKRQQQVKNQDVSSQGIIPRIKEFYNNNLSDESGKINFFETSGSGKGAIGEYKQRIKSAEIDLKNAKEDALDTVNTGVTQRDVKIAERNLKLAKDDFKRFKEKGAINVGAMADDLTKKFSDSGDLTVKHLKYLEGKGTVSKQFIRDLSNKPELKQPERDLIRAVVDEFQDGKINVQEYADRIKARLLPLDVVDSRLGEPQYESVTLPDDLRGNVSEYAERVYDSPISNSAGRVHWGEDATNYFAHTRIEDMADGKTRRVIEAQSDLFQKGRLEREMGEGTIGGALHKQGVRTEAQINKRLDELDAKRDGTDADTWSRAYSTEWNRLIDELNSAPTRQTELAQLQPYRNTWWERIVREEVRSAAQDGKTKLQFPTGETAMKIEGLGGADVTWRNDATGDILRTGSEKVGMQVTDSRTSHEWIITEVLGDGKFKAVPKNRLVTKEVEALQKGKKLPERASDLRPIAEMAEQFDISGKVDTNNPIYKFYEKGVQKYLKKNYNAKQVTDENGVTWIEFDVPKDANKLPVEAFGIGGVLVGAGAMSQTE